MNRDILTVQGSASIVEVGDLVAHRDRDRYDHLVVLEGRRYVGVLPVSEIVVQLAQQRVAFARGLNPLTGLPGNRLIEQEAERRLAAGAPVAALHVDLDAFKAYNDAHGFARGDRVIGGLAQLLQEVLDGEGAASAFLGHIGGDDFIILCEAGEAERIGRRLLRQFRLAFPRPTETGTPALHPSVAGVVVDPADATADFDRLAAVLFEQKRHAKGLAGDAFVLAGRMVERYPPDPGEGRPAA